MSCKNGITDCLGARRTDQCCEHCLLSEIERLREECLAHVEASRISEEVHRETLRVRRETEDRLRARLEKAEEELREVALSGVEFEDERVSYVSVQIDRETWLSLARLRGEG